MAKSKEDLERDVAQLRREVQELKEMVTLLMDIIVETSPEEDGPYPDMDRLRAPGLNLFEHNGGFSM